MDEKEQIYRIFSQGSSRDVLEYITQNQRKKWLDCIDRIIGSPQELKKLYILFRQGAVTPQFSAALAHTGSPEACQVFIRLISKPQHCKSCEINRRRCWKTYVETVIISLSFNRFEQICRAKLSLGFELEKFLLDARCRYHNENLIHLSDGMIDPYFKQQGAGEEIILYGAQMDNPYFWNFCRRQGWVTMSQRWHRFLYCRILKQIRHICLPVYSCRS